MIVSPVFPSNIPKKYNSRNFSAKYLNHSVNFGKDYFMRGSSGFFTRPEGMSDDEFYSANSFFVDINTSIANILENNPDSIPQDVWDKYNTVFFPVDNREVIRRCTSFDYTSEAMYGRAMELPEYKDYKKKMEATVNLLYNKVAELNMQKSPGLLDFVSLMLKENPLTRNSKLSEDGSTIIKRTNNGGFNVTYSEYSAKTGAPVRMLSTEDLDKPVRYAEFNPDETLAKFVEYRDGKPHYELLFPESGHTVIANIYRKNGALTSQRIFDYKNGKFTLSKND